MSENEKWSGAMLSVFVEDAKSASSSEKKSCEGFILIS